MPVGHFASPSICPEPLNSVPLSQLTEQLDGFGVLACGEGGPTTGSVRRDRLQETAELIGGTGVEAAVGTLGQLRNIPERLLDLIVVSFLEHERRHSEATELAGFMGESVGVLLHGVTDEDQGADR